MHLGKGSNDLDQILYLDGVSLFMFIYKGVFPEKKM